MFIRGAFRMVTGMFKVGKRSCLILVRGVYNVGKRSCIMLVSGVYNVSKRCVVQKPLQDLLSILLGNVHPKLQKRQLDLRGIKTPWRKKRPMNKHTVPSP